MKKTKLVLIDSNALVHRAFHAIPGLKNSKGEILNAVYGFSLIFLNMIKELKPTHIIATFDIKKETFRHKKLESYKAKRLKQPDELYNQIPKIKEVLAAFEVPILEKEGYEADDIIATLVQKFKNQIDEIIIVTGDLDALSLASENVKIFTMKQGLTKTEIYDQSRVFERYGFKPENLKEYKGLRGDASDNIPGVRGIGEKTGKDLIAKYQNLETIYKNLDKISPRIKKLLNEQKEQAFLSREVGELDSNVPIKITLAEAIFEITNRQKIVDVFQEYEFKSLLSKIPQKEIKNHDLFSSSQESVPSHQNKYKLIKTEKDFKELILNLNQAKEIAYDVETKTLDMVTGELIGVSFCWKENKAAYLPWSISKNQFQEIKKILENPKIKKIGHNLKYDWAIMKKEGINVKPLYFDTMIASYLSNTQTRIHNLDQVAFVELGYESQSIEELIGKGKEQINLDQVEIEKVGQYSAEDADISFKIYKKLAPKIKSENLKELFYNIEMPLVKILGQMEILGIKLDQKFLKNLNSKITKKINLLKSKIHHIAGKDLNINSTQQLRKVLFEKLQIDTSEIKRTKTGYSTAASELEKMRGKHKIIDLICQYRELTKLKNTYLDALPKLINPKTKRIHTSFNQTITTSGRLSSSDPNLQNIPIKTDLGNEIRKAFIADKNSLILSADYSQIELRLAAHFSKDEKMIQAFKNNEDIHSTTASEIFSKSITKITKKERRIAKTVNFGILYGISAYGLSQSLRISREEASQIIDIYFLKFPRIKTYCDSIIEQARNDNYISTLFNHKRYLPEINSGMVNMKNAAERMAINHPIQGTASEIVKLAMIKIDQENLANSKESKLLLQVHDELVFEIKKNKINDLAPKIKKAMESFQKFKVPLVVDLEIGKNWGNLKKIKTNG